MKKYLGNCIISRTTDQIDAISYHYIKFKPHGSSSHALMIEGAGHKHEDIRVDVPWGQLYESTAIDLGNFEVPFTIVPFIGFSTSTENGSACFIESYGGSASTTSGGSVYAVRPTIQTIYFCINGLAVGWGK